MQKIVELPARFSEKLEKDHQLKGVVEITIAQFEPIINGYFEFFEEYTKHDISHVENVLKTVDNLIPNEAFEILSACDIAVIILSSLIHDMGMHITFEGLKTKLGKLREQKINEFDEFNWDQEWDQFFEEARRWSGKKLISIFGSEIAIKQPPEEKNLLTGYDKKLFGEFLRRKHPRLAHEIAIYGFPAVDGSIIPFAIGLDNDIRDIIGLIGRSHGMNIREMFSYLKDKHSDIRQPYNIRVVYLMVLLRIADYLHITSDRAPNEIVQIRNFSSPLSRKEWDLHNTIKNTHMKHEDPETLFIQAKPETSLMFLKLESLLKDIQKELDISWAVLGEIYGRYDELNILLRRVRSNIDEKKDFAKKVTYLPEAITFNSDPNILKLLVGPLYGNNPTYAVRELLQNAVDACRERTYISELRGLTYEAIIEIRIEVDNNGETFLVITDNGIGMSKETLINYFLKAGASFRRSDNWIKKFTDEQGRSRIQRSGRFGIGIFAAFLVGNEMRVVTRNMDSLDEEGYTFSATIDTEQIEVCRERNEVGTSISIKIRQDVLDELRKQVEVESLYHYEDVPLWFNWYKFEQPEIKLQLPETWNYQENRIKTVAKESSKWQTIYPDGYKEVKWSYDFRKDISNKLMCNGIIIPESYSLSQYTFPAFGPSQSNIPLVSVIDYDSRLPLKLNRNGLQDNWLPFEDQLVVCICEDIVSKALTLPDIEVSNLYNFKLSYPAFSNYYYYGNIYLNDLLIFKDGYCLCHSYNIKQTGLNKITKIWSNKVCTDIISTTDSEGLIIAHENVNSIDDFKNKIDVQFIELDRKYRVESMRIVMPKERYSYLFSGTVERLRPPYKRSIEMELEEEKWVSLTYQKPSVSNMYYDNIDKRIDDITLIVEYYITGEYKDPEQKDVSTQVFSELFNKNVIIPFRFVDRVKQYPDLFEKLRLSKVR